MLKQFHKDHFSEPRFSGGFSKQNTWGRGHDVEWSYGFQTSTGKQYEVWADPESDTHSRMLGEPVAHVAFSDADGSYGITGAGNAREVFTNVAEGLTALLKHMQWPVVYFTAAEASRQRLYDRLVKSITHDLPEYAAIASSAGSDGTRGYIVAMKDRMPDIMQKFADKAGKQADVLVAAYARRDARAGLHTGWQPIQSEKNPAWFTDDSEWVESESLHNPLVTLFEAALNRQSA